MRARIARRVLDQERRSALEVEAERLNPDAWVTDGEVQRGLDQYEAAFESLASAVGRRRRRRRARGARPAEGDAGTAGPPEAAGEGAPGDERRAARLEQSWEPGAGAEDDAAEEEEAEGEEEEDAG